MNSCGNFYSTKSPKVAPPLTGQGADETSAKAT